MKRKKVNKKKKGFTLIELLAVILILGIIALIAVPQVTNVIGSARKGAAETSAEHYIGAVNNKIALSKLEQNSGNKIENGTVDISNISVDITGEPPESGTVTIRDGIVVRADLVVDGYTVTCDAKGKCEASNSKYVYYASVGTPTSVSDCVTSRPTNQNAYLKFAVENNKLGTPQACLYDNGEEVCLEYDKYFESYDKILAYYEYDEHTWSQSDTPGLETIWTGIVNGERRQCQVEGDYLMCYNPRIRTYVDQISGEIETLDMSTNYGASIDGDGETLGFIYSGTP